MAAVVKIGGHPPTQADFHRAIMQRSDRWYSACLKITRNPDLAADAVQDALLNAWRKRDQFNSASRLDTWIHRIAINAALNLLRKSRPGVFEALETDVEDHSDKPDQILQDHEMESDLAASLARLTEVERVVDCLVSRRDSTDFAVCSWGHRLDSGPFAFPARSAPAPPERSPRNSPSVARCPVPF